MPYASQVEDDTFDAEKSVNVSLNLFKFEMFVLKSKKLFIGSVSLTTTSI